MKKALFLVAAATLALLSCQKEIENTNDNPVNHGITLKASMEAFDTKAEIDDENQLVWWDNEKIGVYVNDDSWTVKNQRFTLINGGLTVEGEFAWDNTETFTNTNANAAFFPWDDNDNLDDGTLNNIYEGYAYFTLHEGVYSYSDGKMLTPLVAKISDISEPIKFKHAGAAVSVTINNVPAHSHSLGMTVAGQQITGEFSVKVENAGTDAMTVVGPPDDTKNTVWLNYWQGSQSTMTFVFPVPELTKPKLSFQMYDENDILVWSKKLKAQASDLKRGDVLVMPAIDITPYSQFKESTEWTFCGTIGGKNAWDADIPMYTDGTVCILPGINFAANDEFKIRKNKAWGTEYPSSNYVVTSAGKKDVWFTPGTGEIVLKDAKCPYPAPKVTLYFGINTSGGSGIAISSSTLAPGYGWPGLTLTEREFINNKWYYKHVVDGPTVWGTTASASIVGIGQWNTTSSTLSFTDIKTEYYFEATSGAAIEQLSARPTDSGSSSVSITIGSGFTDWASVEGVTNGNHTVKVASDATNIYVYSSRTSASGDYSAIWGGGGYVYVSLDLDNDSTTGSGDIYGNKAEYIALFYPYSTAYTFNTTKQSDWQSSPSTYALDNVTLYGEGDASAATIEFCFPRANLPTIPSTDPITIKVWGNKGMSTVSLTRKL